LHESVLSLQGIRKSFGQQLIIDNISIDIRHGEFLTLLGPSGCGKTTALRIVAGLESAEAGQVFLNGRDVTELEPERRNVNTVFQNYALFPHMNVHENIAYGPRIRRLAKPETKALVAEMLALVKMTGFEKRMPHQLSGGQRQRIAIARALVNRPDIVLLDEPLGALDLKLRKHMQTELKQIQKQTGITFIYVTHDQEEALNMSDRLAIMNNGKFEQIGTPREVYDRPQTRFVAEFVGTRNILPIAGTNSITAIHADKTRMHRHRQTAADLEGIVIDTSYGGAQTKTLVAVGDIPLTVIDYNTPQAVQAGDTVYLSWDEADGVVIHA